MSAAGRILALSGGVGGARLAAGLAGVLPEGQLSVLANTGDDFEHLGLHVSPDIDTLLYTISGLNNPDTGWGRDGETWSFLAELERLGMETWFRIGDRDLAVHVWRTRGLREGRSLSAVTADLARRFKIPAEVIPMSDDPVRTMVVTDGGELAFQDYFVRRRCEPVASAIRFEGAAGARPPEALLRLLRQGSLDGIVICPSNPYLSIDPILAVPGVTEALRTASVPIVAVTPIVGGDAIKGPTAKMMREFGHEVSPAAVAEHYRGLIDGMIVDGADESLAGKVRAGGIAVEIADTVMQTPRVRATLARAVLHFIERLRNGNTEGAANRRQ